MKETVVFYLTCFVGLLGLALFSLHPGHKKGEKKKDAPQEQVDTLSLRRATVYHAVVAQCDADPLITADGSYIDTCLLNKGQLQWIALSQDLVDDPYKAKLHKGLFKGMFKFGDTVYVSSTKHAMMNGYYVVKDVMNRRYKQSMDFLMPVKGARFLGRDFKICKK